MAAVIAMFQSLLEGKTDCPISGVFGAGKTLSAAAMIAGLLVMDPSLKIMIVLWMGLHQEKFPLLATSLQPAARVGGRQKWALILPSSARVLLVTYTAFFTA